MSEIKSSQEALIPPVSRREFIATVGVGVASATVLTTGVMEAEPAAETLAHEPTEGSAHHVPISLWVNGTQYEIGVEPRWTLATVLRRELGMTGTKIVCDRGECGACTVIRNDQLIYSCMTLAVDCDRSRIETIEGVALKEKLHPLQQAFIDNDALQCGYCTPGMVMALKHLLDHQPRPALDDVKEACAGNLCRCGTYPNVFKAALEAAQKMR
ncbi:MAG: (2Fe-2S)-binding protein [Acidobacteriia bacterium]|nr:(2Fe-2S)-binding protein [Terriglobia bacterium]